MNNTSKQKSAPVLSGNVVNANIHAFTAGTANRADRIVEACKPITDVWFKRFRDAANVGAESVILAWHDYKHMFFTSSEHPHDEVFRYIAFVLIVNGIKTGFSLRLPVYLTLKLVLGQMTNEFEYFYPRQRFGIEREVYDFAKDIDTLFLEYQD